MGLIINSMQLTPYGVNLPHMGLLKNLKGTRGDYIFISYLFRLETTEEKISNTCNYTNLP